jgi:uncharacterized protein (DUF342 family)
LKLKYKVINGFEEVSEEIGDDSNAFEDLEIFTKESIEKYQRHIMALRQILKKQDESETKQRIKLDEKEEEIKRLKNEIISQEEEKKKVDDELSKIIEELK